MTKSIFKHVQIKGINTVIPNRIIALDDELQYYNNIEKLEKLKKTVGLNKRCVVDHGITPADLMECAAKHILDDMKIDKSTIDVLICVLDNPDYKIPPTSCVLHGKLGLSQTCMAFDVNHGCAGYVYGLAIAHSMIESKMAQRVLLLVGDTKSQTINIADRISAPLFGDGASATILDYSNKEQNSAFVIGTKGTLYDNIMIPAGGARLPCSSKTRKTKVDEFGNVRSLENFTMNGRAVFDFTMLTVPKNIKEIMALADLTADNIDYLILHQANRSILMNIASRTGFNDLSKVPMETLSKFGNLSIASIPSVINDQLFEQCSTQQLQLLICGFGVGLAWGSAIINLDKIYCPMIYKYKE